ncbi:hypothetical protein E5170_25720 [Pseudomonas atacamensis]|uniref:Uncharacterized protein n=1 Tax=Pseudomonas atacamensis TaxID=2565368 RepID=A0AAQ2D729_9PSED|nr:hypothetical protein E5170_25720 [Pseudomonas atacamensis]
MRRLSKACEKSIAHHKAPVGASLLAKASCQATLLLTEPPLSRAGSLPQEDLHRLGISSDTTSLPA